MRKKKLRELFRRERRKAATSGSPITINRDSEVFKKYLETRDDVFGSQSQILISRTQ